MNTKITDRAIYEAIANDTLGTIDTAVLTAWAEKKIAQLDHKAAKARENAAAKRAEGDELAAAVLNAVTDEFQTIADIAANIDSEDVTVSKVAYRLNAAAKEGKLEKGEVVIDGDGKKRRVVAYKRA